MTIGLVHDGRDLLSVDEVAARKRVWASTVRGAIRRGLLEGVRLYGRLYVYADSVDAYEPVYGRGNFKTS